MLSISGLVPTVSLISGRHAIFLVANIGALAEHADAVRGLCEDLPGLVRTVGTRDPDLGLSCAFGFSAGAWKRLFGAPRPIALHPFQQIEAGPHIAPSTQGDLFFQIRSEGMDQCFELAKLVMEALGSAIEVTDEVHAFRYFERRAVIGFVDGTENPTGRVAEEFVLIGEEDVQFKGGTYVVIQKFMHDMKAWEGLTDEQQELVIGRRKQSNVELPDEAKPPSSHVALTTLVKDGREIKILRGNLPFGRPGSAEYGTYFVAYARSPEPIEQMLERMYVGSPRGTYDRLLDFSKAVTGGLYFVPSAELLESLADRSGA